MQHEVVRRSHQVFTQAIEITEPLLRARFIEQSCSGDVRLLRHVQSLMRAMDTTAGFLERPVLQSAASTSSAATPGQMIGGYRVVRQIGAGGMAAVYEAMQESPSRRVALKVMRHGLSGTSGVQRFRFETEVLARLQHPGIAQIYEAGASDDGRGTSTPFFAMEFLADAMPITSYAEAHALSIDRRLQMVAEVCDAVHYGHQLGVIHRDLKPGNILVDTSGRPRVIDFGVARSIDPTLPSVTQQTDVGQVVGTLNYMSPEQCVGRPIDIRTDIYALGVVLYELLCRCLPHQLNDVPLPEAARRITEGKATRPSVHAPQTRGDIEAIILKAIDVDPVRRYQSAAGLATDIRRYLGDQPVEARAPTAAYQLRKFARRHRPVVAAASAALVILIAGVAATTRMAFVATRAQQASEQRGAELEQVVAFQESQLSEIDVREMGELIRKAIDENVKRSIAEMPSEHERASALMGLQSVAERANFTTVALRAIDEGVLQRWRKSMADQFASQPLVRARLLQRLATTMNRLGLFKETELALAEALAIRRQHLGPDHPDTLHTQSTMGAVLMSLGRYDESIAVLEQTYAQRNALQGADHPATLRTGTSLGGALRLGGRLADAERVWRATYDAQLRTLGPDHIDTLRSLNNVGVILAVQGNSAEAESCWRELVERQRRVLGPESPALTASQMNLANVLADRGAYGDAVPLLESVLAANRKSKGDDHDDTLSAMMNLALVRREMGDLAGAEAMQRACLERRQRVLGPVSPKTLHSAATLASIQAETGALEAAESLARMTLVEQRKLLGDDHHDTIESIVILASILRDSSSLEESLALSAEASERANRVFPDGHWMLGHVLSEHGRILGALARWGEAEAKLLKGYEALASGEDAPVHARLRAAKALGEHYDARHRAEPEAGHDRRAAEWRAKSVRP